MLWNPAFHSGLALRPSVVLTPPALANPVHGLDTSDASQLYSDMAGTTPAQNGNLVARVPDAFGGPRFLRGTSPTDRPTLVLGAANGRPALRFGTGGAKFMSVQQAQTGTIEAGELFRSLTFTLCMAYRRAATGTFVGLFAAGSSTGGQNGQGYDMLHLEGAETGPPMLSRHTGSQKSWAILNGPGYVNDVVTKVVARCAPGSGMELTAKSAAGTFSGSGSPPSSADQFVWDYAIVGAQLGWAGAPMPQAPFTGDVMEFRFWNSHATTAERDALLAYLDVKWGA
jgi:hypothetical protein